MSATVHSPERWKQIEALFHESLKLSAELRAAFLADQCSSDTELRREVEMLLNSAEQPLNLVEESIAHAAREFVSRERESPVCPGKVLDHYEITSRIGAGGMGEVYLAHDTRLKRKVAIKILSSALTHDERGLRRFEQEARAASALNHPNILTIFEFGQADGIHFIASEYVEGEPLRQKLAPGRLETSVAFDICIQIARALEAAHSSGIVHRDIKPDNVIVRNDGLVKVLDFGIAKLTESHSGQTSYPAFGAASLSLSQAGVVIGSAKYMSPEQARGLSVDARSDLFSLGVVLYEMIAGKAPFEGQTVSDVIAEVLKSTPPSLDAVVPDVPSRVSEIVARAMCKDRDARYQTSKDMLGDLQEFADDIQFKAKFKKAGPLAMGSAAAIEPIAFRNQALTASLEVPGTSPTGLRRSRLAMTLVPLVLVIIGLMYAGFVYRKSGATGAGTQTRSLAILPFRNLRQDPSLDYLGFSLADAAITKLGYIRTLIVRPSSSVDKYRNQNADPRTAGRELNVDTLLTGGFIKDGDDLRITAQLIDVNSNRILWRDSIDVKYDKLLTVQDRVTQQIVKGLELNLTPAEAQHLKPESPIDPLAYEDYLRGIDLYSSNDFAGAITMLEKSTSIDPNYAPAWAHLAKAYTTNASLQMGGREQYDKAQAAYEKAMALNPALSEVRIYMANTLTDTGRVEQAVPLLRTALQTSPNNAELHWELGYAYRFAGMLEESVSECEQARQNDPGVKINSSAMNAYLYLGQYEKFLQSLPVKDSAYILFYRGLAEYYLGHRERAAENFDRAYLLDSSLLTSRIGKSFSHSIAGRRTAALNLLRQTEDEMETRGVGDAELMYKVAQAYAVLGDKPSALHTLQHTIEGGFFCFPCFVSDPLLAALRTDPDFQRLTAEARKRHEQFKARFF
jgi:TolB-like protein/Tfp pilus assembly protein PilF